MSAVDIGWLMALPFNGRVESLIAIQLELVREHLFTIPLRETT